MKDRRVSLSGGWWWGVQTVYQPQAVPVIYRDEDVEDCPCAAQCIERFVITGIECECKCHEPR